MDYGLHTVSVTVVGVIYIIDRYKDAARQAMIVTTILKIVSGFLLTYYVGSWVGQSGISPTIFFTMGCVCFVILLGVVFWFQRQ